MICRPSQSFPDDYYVNSLETDTGLYVPVAVDSMHLLLKVWPLD